MNDRPDLEQLLEPQPLEPLMEFYGFTAEFCDQEALLLAARTAYVAGYREIDAFTPFPVEGLAEALGQRSRAILPYLALGAMGAGAVGGFALQYYVAVIAYPLNVGGRPLNSWPAFLPLAFETMFLLAAVAVFGAMLMLAGLPARHRSLRRAPHFALTSRERFFLVIKSEDSQFDVKETHRFLKVLNPVAVNAIHR